MLARRSGNCICHRTLQIASSQSFQRTACQRCTPAPSVTITQDGLQSRGRRDQRDIPSEFVTRAVDACVLGLEAEVSGCLCAASFGR